MIDRTEAAPAAERERLFDALRRLERRCRDNAAGLPEQEARPEIWQGVLYLVGETTFLSALTEIEEVLDPPQEVTRVPAAKHWVRGIANSRGTLLPIFDLQAFLFGAPTASTPRNRVLVARRNEFPFGLLVSDVLGIRHFERSTYGAETPDLGGGIEDLLDGSLAAGGERYPMLSLQKLAVNARFNLAAA